MSKFRFNFRGLWNSPVFNAIVTNASAVLGAIVKLLIELKHKFPKAVIRGHNEMHGAVPKSCPVYKPSKEYAYMMK